MADVTSVLQSVVRYCNATHDVDSFLHCALISFVLIKKGYIFPRFSEN